MYNLTELQNADTISGLATFANNTTEGKLVGLFMIAIFFIIFFLMKRYPAEEGILSASLICFILSGIFTLGGYLNIMFALSFLIILALTTLYIYTTRN